MVRNVLNVDNKHEDAIDIPSSLNTTRSRKAYAAKVEAFRTVVKRKSTFKRDIVEAVQARAARVHSRHGGSTRNDDGSLPSKIKIGPDVFVDTLPLPTSYQDAITGPYRDYWIKAIAEELDNLRDHGVWKKQPLPKHIRPI